MSSQLSQGPLVEDNSGVDRGDVCPVPGDLLTWNPHLVLVDSSHRLIMVV